jgi:hypothetical protein
MSTSRGVDKISTLNSLHQKVTLMATINTWDTSDSAFRVNVYQWDSFARDFGTPSQVIHAYHPTAVHLTETLREGPFTYLFISEGEVNHLRNQPLLRIHRFAPGFKYPFVEMQQIRESQVVSIDSTLMTDNSLVVFMLTSDSLLKMYKLRGASGFTLFDTVVTRGAHRFLALPRISPYGHVEGHVLVLSMDSTRSRDQQETDTRLLYPKITGRSVPRL